MHSGAGIQGGQNVHVEFDQPEHPGVELERTIRGLERMGYRIYAVEHHGALMRFVTRLPTTDARRRTRLRTAAKWLGKWSKMQHHLPPRTIAEHLAGTGRTEVTILEKANFSVAI